MRKKKILILTSIIITLLIVLLIMTHGSMYFTKSIWNKDSTNVCTLKTYSLGATSGGYTIIEVNEIERFKYPLTVIEGRWINKNSLKLVSSHNYIKKYSTSNDVSFQTIVATTYQDYASDTLLIRLSE